MAILDLFFKRQKRARGEVPDVFRYDDLPPQLRVQIVHIIQDAVHPRERSFYKRPYDVMIRELGRFYLKEPRSTLYGPEINFAGDAFEYFLEEKSAEIALSFVELWFQGIVQHYRHDCRVAVAAIEELNTRFREHGVGYEFVDNTIVRVDSALIHQEAVKPALVVLRDRRYAAAEKEFLEAYEHYRHGKFESALTEALKALESTLKVICKRQGWAFGEGDTAKKLLNVAFSNGLVPTYLQAEFTSLRATLESGVPTIRNRQGGHGAGDVPRNVPRHLVSYALHMTASAILFLSEAEGAMR